MEELIFFAVIIFFSIIESIARSRKGKKGGGRIEDAPSSDRETGEWEFEWAQKSPDELPTYDQEPSYDDLPSYDDAVTGRPPAAPRSLEEKKSSRTLLPGGLLEELAGMAEKLEVERQKMEQAEAEARRAPTSSSERADEQERWEERQQRRDARARERERTAMARRTPRSVVPSRGPARPLPEHRVHLAHAGYGTDPSERARSEQDGLDPLARTLSADAKAVRKQLLSESTSALRRAIILQEVLGPPKAMREEEPVV